MKKLGLILLTLLSCSLLMSGACSKVCTCKGYVGGVPLTEYEENIDFGDKCSSLNTYDETLKTGTKCR